MSDTYVNLVHIRSLSVWFDIYLSDSQLILMSFFWRQICRNAFVEPIETRIFASISPRSLVPVWGLLISGFQLKVLPQQTTSCVSIVLLVFRIQLEPFFIVWWSCFFLLAKPRHLSHKRLSNLAGEATSLDRWSEHFVSGYLSLPLISWNFISAENSLICVSSGHTEPRNFKEIIFICSDA